MMQNSPALPGTYKKEDALMGTENDTYQQFAELSRADKLKIIDFAERLREAQCNLPPAVGSPLSASPI